MSDKPKRGDFYSGIPWVDVTPEQARGHPKGQLNWILWLIAAYFIGSGIYKFAAALYFDAGLLVAILSSIWPFLAGVGLALRVPWAVVMAVVSALLSAYTLIQGIGDEGGVFILFETIASVGILFYLVDGDRPNLIYRHRYRKYSVERDPQSDAE